jgi:Glutathione S-transferase N-terminal domain
MNKIRIGPAEGKERVENENSVIVLHQFPRTSRAPSFSPYPIKVETFLRMNKLEYVSDFKNFFGPKGKCPWITDTDGKAVADSEFIIQVPML